MLNIEIYDIFHKLFNITRFSKLMVVIILIDVTLKT